MPTNIRRMLMAAALISAAPPAFADVITDWDEKAVAIVNPMPPYNGQRSPIGLRRRDYGLGRKGRRHRQRHVAVR